MPVVMGMVELEVRAPTNKHEANDVSEQETLFKT